MTSPENKRHLDKIEEYFYKASSMDGLCPVQVIERINLYINLKTIQKYADDNGISYNGAKNNRKIITLFGCKFIADNI